MHIVYRYAYIKQLKKIEFLLVWRKWGVSFNRYLIVPLMAFLFATKVNTFFTLHMYQ